MSATKTSTNQPAALRCFTTCCLAVSSVVPTVARSAQHLHPIQLSPWGRHAVAELARGSGWYCVVELARDSGWYCVVVLARNSGWHWVVELASVLLS